MISFIDYTAQKHILFGYHGNIQFWKRNFLSDNFFKTTEAVWLQFGTNVAWVNAIQNS